MCGIAEKLYERRDVLMQAIPRDDEDAGLPTNALYEIVDIDRLVGQHAESCPECDGVREDRGRK